MKMRETSRVNNFMRVTVVKQRDSGISLSGHTVPGDSWWHVGIDDGMAA
jgi:hypothetical protein